MDSPWCYRCRAYAKKGAAFCSKCGQKVRAAYVSSETPEHPDPPWQNTWTRAPSPRRMPSPGCEKGKGKGYKGGKHKTRPDSRPRNPPPAPPKPIVEARAPNMADMPAAPSTATPAMPKSAAPAAEGSQDSRLLDALVAHVHAYQHGPERAPHPLEAHMQSSAKQEGIMLHRLVNQKQKAKQALDKVRTERLRFVSAWQDYLTKLLDIWEKQLEAYELSMSKFNEVELAWQAEFLTASTALKEQVREGRLEAVEDTADEMMITPITSETEAMAREAQASQQHLQLRDMFAKAKETATANMQALNRDRENSRSPRRLKANAPSPTADPWRAIDKEAAATAATAAMARTAAAAGSAKEANTSLPPQ